MIGEKFVLFEVRVGPPMPKKWKPCHVTVPDFPGWNIFDFRILFVSWSQEVSGLRGVSRSRHVEEREFNIFKKKE